MQPLAIRHMTTTNALGHGLASTWEALIQRRSGLALGNFGETNLTTYLGRVNGLESLPVKAPWRDYDCRNNRLAQWGLQGDGFMTAVEQARGLYGAARIAVILGTSTSGILETERAYQQRDDRGRLPRDFRFETVHENFSVTDFVRHTLGLQGPALTVSTACSSSAKVFATASRWIAAGLCDAAVVGGVDSLCLTTLYGFSSLEIVSSTPCRPADRNRNGISIGEGAGFALLERATPDMSIPCLLGYGESSDAHHMSSPHPEGAGAQLSMQRALACSGLRFDQIDYINLHGTATPANDRAEDRAIGTLFGHRPPCSSTKGWTGHTLGASGIIEAIMALLCLKHNFIPGTLNTTEIDPSFTMNVILDNQPARLSRVLSNSFGFGGSNASLVFGYPS